MFTIRTIFAELSSGIRIGGAIRSITMNFVSADKIVGDKTNEVPRCRCGAQPRLVRKMLDPRKGRTILMFECECGEHTWDE